MNKTNTSPQTKKLFTHQINVRIDDINFGNHLCHSKFITIIHNTRALFLKKHGLCEKNCFGFGLAILNLNIDYLSQCFFDDILEINLYSGNIRKSAFSLEYSIFNYTSNKLAARATNLIGFLDLEIDKLKPIPKDFLSIITDSINES